MNIVIAFLAGCIVGFALTVGGLVLWAIMQTPRDDDEDEIAARQVLGEG